MTKASLKLVKSSGEHCYKLQSVMDISNAKPFYDEIASMLGNASSICLDASEVSRMTTPCVQIIIALSKHANENGLEVSLAKPSDAFMNAFKQLGLDKSEFYQDLISGE
jgi:chemotaxis protein CheX